MNPEDRAVAVTVLKEYFVSLALHPEDASQYTPNKVIRMYLRDTTLVRAMYDTGKAVRTTTFWTALFFGSSLGKHARHSELYRNFLKDVITRSGITIDTTSSCSVATHLPNCVTGWQVMALFYMSGDPLKVIRSVIPEMHILLVAGAAILLPLNMKAFALRCAKMTQLEYDMHLSDMTLDADYAIISSISMADLNPSLLLPPQSSSSSYSSSPPLPPVDDVIVINSSHKRKQVIVAPSGRSSPRATRPDMVRWTAVDTQLFQMDERWTQFKLAALLSPDHPPLGTICAYLAKLPNPPVSIPHSQFVMNYMPYFDVHGVFDLDEVREFATCLRAHDPSVDEWAPAKLVTRLVWLYDPYSAGGMATSELTQYVAKYPRLTSTFIWNLVTI